MKKCPRFREKSVSIRGLCGLIAKNLHGVQIGLLNFRLSLTNNDMGGKKNALLFFQVTRQIGSY